MLKINIFRIKFKKVNILTFKSIFETITELWKSSNLYLVFRTHNSYNFKESMRFDILFNY